MKTAKEIAQNVEPKYDRQYATGKAQQIVLDALGIKNCAGHSHAQRIFDAIGITVSNRRVGRKSIPVVYKAGGGSARNDYGDYDVWQSPSENVDLSAISEWMAD